MKFKMCPDWYHFFWYSIRTIIIVAGVWVFNSQIESIWFFIFACVITVFAAYTIYLDFNSYIELTEDEMIVHSGLAKVKVPLADLTKMTREELKATGRKNQGFVVRDGKTTTSGETKIVVYEEDQFIKELLVRAPHIQNELKFKKR